VVGGRASGVELELHLAGDVKKTDKKVTWLPDTPDLVPITRIELDYLITVTSLDEGDDFQAALNPVTRLDTHWMGEPVMRALQAGDIIQIERYGYWRCDKPITPAGSPMELIAIPDGRVKGLFNLAARVGGAAAGAGAPAPAPAPAADGSGSKAAGGGKKAGKAGKAAAAAAAPADGGKK